MDFSLLTLVLSLFTLGVVIFIFLRLRDQDQKDSGQTEILENKIDSVSKDLNDIENQLASVTTPINELNRFLGGNVTTGRQSGQSRLRSKNCRRNYHPNRLEILRRSVQTIPRSRPSKSKSQRFERLEDGNIKRRR